LLWINDSWPGSGVSWQQPNVALLVAHKLGEKKPTSRFGLLCIRRGELIVVSPEPSSRKMKSPTASAPVRDPLQVVRTPKLIREQTD
jgi:hypothetical protein